MKKVFKALFNRVFADSTANKKQGDRIKTLGTVSKTVVIQNKKGQSQELTVPVFEITAEVRVNKDPNVVEAAERLKKIRADIRDAKENNDTGEQIRQLELFQNWHIEQAFPHGEKEIYRFVKFLESVGMAERAQAEREKVEGAFARYNAYQHKEYVRKVKNRKPDYVRFYCYSDEAPLECQARNDLVERFEGSENFMQYARCENKPRCYCRAAGMSERAYKQSMNNN